MNRLPFLAGLLAVSSSFAADAAKPNIVVILADDLGWGDVKCNNPDAKIPTPHIDRLASQGMRFTDAHSSSGVCSPSRYTLLTGRYHWRTRLQAGIVGTFGAPLIAPDRLTIAGLVKGAGYRTACIGKWHLGWDWPVPAGGAALLQAAPKDGKAEPTDEQRALWKRVFSEPIGGGPTTRGFDVYFGTDVPNWPPYCFIENDRTVGIPSTFLSRELIGNNIASKQGPALPEWKLERILPALADRACGFIEMTVKEGKPFLLYMPLTSPHTPLSVNPEFRGKSGLNVYADLVMETDAAVGRVLDALDKSGAAGNTLVVFTSDNGCAPYVGAAELERRGHRPSGPYRGYKADAWEGGHRVPFVVRWPGKVAPGTRCDRLVLQADLIATFAEVLGVKLPDTAGEDSRSLTTLLAGADKPVREFAIHQSSGGLLAIRKGPWKLIFGMGGGGFGGKAAKKKADGPAGQLYHMDDDPGETKNRFDEKPEVVAELTALMKKLIDDGRSTPGTPQKNDVPVRWAPVSAKE